MWTTSVLISVLSLALITLLLCLCYLPLQSFILGFFWRRRHHLQPGAFIKYRDQIGRLKKKSWWGLALDWSTGMSSWISYRQLENDSIEVINQQHYLEPLTFNFETHLHYHTSELLAALSPSMMEHPHILSSPSWTVEWRGFNQQRQQQWTLKLWLLPMANREHQAEIQSWLYSMTSQCLKTTLHQSTATLPPLPQ